MKTKQFIFRKQREIKGHEDITDFYFMNNGKPVFILGYRKEGDLWGKQKMKNTLLNLRAANYKYAAICSQREIIKDTVKELIEKKIADGYIITHLLYNSEAKQEMMEYKYIDLIFTVRKNFDSEYYNYRFYDFEAYKEAEKYLIPLTSHLVIEENNREKFPGSTIIVKKHPDQFLR